MKLNLDDYPVFQGIAVQCWERIKHIESHKERMEALEEAMNEIVPALPDDQIHTAMGEMLALKSLGYSPADLAKAALDAGQFPDAKLRGERN